MISWPFDLSRHYQEMPSLNDKIYSEFMALWRARMFAIGAADHHEVLTAANQALIDIIVPILEREANMFGTQAHAMVKDVLDGVALRWEREGHILDAKIIARLEPKPDGTLTVHIGVEGREVTQEGKCSSP